MSNQHKIQTYINSISTPIEKNLYRVLSTYTSMNIELLSKQIIVGSEQIRKICNNSPVFSYDKKEKTVSLLNEPKEYTITKDKREDNKTFLIFELIESENSFLYSYADYLKAIQGQKQVRYSLELDTELQAVSATTFKVQKNELRRKYFFLLSH